MKRKPHSRRKRNTTKSVLRLPDLEHAKAAVLNSLTSLICDVLVLGSAMLREASWSRSNSFWGMFRCKRLSVTLGANSGFDQRSMTISVSSRILEIAEGLPTIQSCNTAPIPR
jgi:hypothetical protein